MKTFHPNPTAVRRLLACVGLVALLALGVLRMAAHAQEDDVPAPRNGSSTPAKAAVFVDKDRNAVIQIDTQRTARDISTGTVTAGSDLASGLSTVTANMEFSPESAAKMKGMKVTTYGQVDTNNTLFLGTFNVPLQDDLQKAKIDGDAKVQQNDKNVHAELTFSGNVPKPSGSSAPLSKLALDATSKTDYKTFNGKLSLNVNAEVMKQSPLKDLDLNIAEPDANTTSLDLNITVDLGNPMAAQMKPQLEQIKSNPTMFEGMIKSTLEKYAKVETLSLKADVTGNDGKITFSVKLSGLRAKLNEQMSKMADMPGLEIDPAALKQAVENMLAITVDKFNLNAKVAGDALTASITADAKNFDKFLAGYTVVMSMVQEASFKQQQLRSADNKPAQMAFKWWHAIQKHLSELSQTSMTEMAAAGATVSQSFKLDVDVKDQVTFNGSASQDVTNFDKAFTAMKSKGFPMLDGAGLIAHVKTDNGVLGGSVFLSAKGNVPQLLKTLFVDPAKNEAELKPAADLLSTLNWQDGRLSLTLNDTKLAYQSFVKTSDLTPVVGAIQAVGMPELVGALKGVRFDATSKEGKQNTTARFGYTSFMTGKSGDDIKTMMGKVFDVTDVTVNESADANQIALSKVEEPKIEMPAELASLKGEGETQVAAVPSAPGAAGGAGGMNTNVLIGIGVAILALLGIVMASGKKKG